MRFNKFVAIVFLLACGSINASAQYSKLYKSEDFSFHFNESSEERISFLDSTFKVELGDLQKRVNYYTNNPLDILLLENSSFTASNIIGSFEPVVEGQVKLSKSQVSIDLQSNLNDIIAQFRFQVIKILVDEMMFGGSFQDRIKNANVINLPDWVLPGLFHYVAYQWDVATDNEMRFVQETYGLQKFNRIPKSHDIVKGASFWKYLEHNYGEFAIPNLLYMARRSPKFNGAIYFAFQANMVDVYRGWEKFFRKAYESEQNRRNPVNGMSLAKDKLIDLHLLNPKELITLESTPFGHSLFRVNLINKKRTKIYSLSKDEECYRQFSGSISSVGDTIVLITKVLNQTKFTFIANQDYTSEYTDAKVSSLNGAENSLYYLSSSFDSSRVYNYQRGEVLSFHGYINSFDVFGDILAFISNSRLGSDIWTYHLKTGVTKNIYQSKEELRQIIFANNNNLLYNSNESGIWNGQIFSLENFSAKPVTNYRSNILYHQYSDSIFLEYLDQSNNSSLYKSEPLGLEDFFIYDTIYPTAFHNTDSYVRRTNSKPKLNKLDSLSSYSFQSPINSAYDFTLDNYDSLESNGLEFTISAIDAKSNLPTYNPYTAFLSLTNQPLVTSSSGFERAIPLLTPNRLNISIGGSLSDTYEKNYLKIGFLGLLQAGARDIEFQYFKLGKSILDFRFLNRRRIVFDQDLRDGFRTTLLSIGTQSKVDTKILFKNRLEFRNDRFDPFLFNVESLSEIPLQKWITRFQSSLSYHSHSAQRSLDVNFNLEPMVNIDNREYSVSSSLDVGFKHILHSKISYIGTFKAGTSQGTSPNFYMIGGYSTDLLTEFTNRSFSDFLQPMIFKNVFGVRGFGVNYRNGNTYFLHSSQVGIQLLDYFFTRPIASEVFSNLIFHSFFDIGTSFYGASIYDKPNVLNSTLIESQNGGIRIERRAFKNPLIFSTGIGMSTKVYGYDVSVDYAYGYEDQKFQNPIWHFGLGLPF